MENDLKTKKQVRAWPWTSPGPAWAWPKPSPGLARPEPGPGLARAQVGPEQTFKNHQNRLNGIQVVPFGPKLCQNVAPRLRIIFQALLGLKNQ